MSGRTEDEIEGLANRLALLASDSGEADNAGRAVGALARRLGLSGGDLKAIFLAGAAAGAVGRPGGRRGRDASESLDMAAASRQISALRHSLTLAEVAIRNAERERDALRRENATLVIALARRQTSGQVTRIAATAVLAAAVAGGVYTIALPAFRAPPSPVAEAPLVRAAIVHPTGARLFSQPNRGAAIITSIPPGTRLTVKRLVVNVLVQWAEVDFAGRSGYVVSTDVEMP